jgi:hypothetical protein
LKLAGEGTECVGIVSLILLQLIDKTLYFTSQCRRLVIKHGDVPSCTVLHGNGIFLTSSLYLCRKNIQTPLLGAYVRYLVEKLCFMRSDSNRTDATSAKKGVFYSIAVEKRRCFSALAGVLVRESGSIVTSS